MDEDEEDTEFFVLLCAILPFIVKDDPVPCHNSILSGNLYYQELMNTNSEPRFRNANRMDISPLLIGC